MFSFERFVSNKYNKGDIREKPCLLRFSVTSKQPLDGVLQTLNIWHWHVCLVIFALAFLFGKTNKKELDEMVHAISITNMSIHLK